MRERNIEITANRMKPRTQFYVYFDNVDVTKFTTPKLLEIEMISGVFQAGERVHGHHPGAYHKTFNFRLAAPNHKEGPYNAPTKVLSVNPYDNEAPIPSVYSTSSTLLNIDTFHLATQVSQNLMVTVQLA